MTDAVPQTEADSKETEVYHSRHEGRQALIQLVLVIVAALIASIATGVTKTVFVVLAVVVMVMVHEFGHYMTAKWSGMKVTEFFLGFGPRVWSFKWGETEYGVRAIPAGGFVKVIGMNNLEKVEPEEESRAFRSSPVWRRVVMASAGSFMHFVMAFFLVFALLVGVGKPAQTANVGQILTLQGKSPAVEAGLKVGDTIRSVNGNAVTDWKGVTDQLAAARAGVPLPVTVQRDGVDVPLTITPVDRRQAVQANGAPVQNVDPNVAKGFIGISSQLTYNPVPVIEAVPASFKALGTGTVDVFRAFGKMFSPHGMKTYWQNLTGTVPEAKQAEADQLRFVSPVGLVGTANNAANSGWFAVLSLLFSINLFIGIFNMVPLLPFDGGHVAVALYEKVRSFRRPNYHADYAKLLPVSYAVLLVLVFIAGSSLYLDVTNPLPNPFKQ